jgi:hypothetical protein
VLYQLNAKTSREIRLLKKEIRSLKKEINKLTDVVSKSHAKMDQHVDFVEGVYTSIRHPLDFAKKRIEYFMGDTSSTHTQLPQIECEKK